MTGLFLGRPDRNIHGRHSGERRQKNQDGFRLKAGMTVLFLGRPDRNIHGRHSGESRNPSSSLKGLP
jgi:hypothetical protein